MVSTPIIAIIGPTASGKSALAMRLAQELSGEIICADSRTIYRGMDIGTAKPTPEDRARVPHHLLDVVEPGQTYSAAEFKVEAEREIDTIVARGNVPFIVGGTGLYVYSLLYDYQFPAGARTQERVKLEATPLSELVERLQREDPGLASQIELQNPRRVIRAIETIGLPRLKAKVLQSNILLIGLRPDEAVLNQQIVQRTSAMLQIGMVAEVRSLVTTYGADCEAFRSPGYAEIIDFLAGKTTLTEAEALINLHTRQLVRRQLTWFKRNAEIRWFDAPDEAAATVHTFITEA